MVLSMFTLLFACTGGPSDGTTPIEPVEPVVETPATDPDTPPNGRIDLSGTQPPEDLLGTSWSVTLSEPLYQDLHTVQLKLHEGQLWCYEEVRTGRNVAMFKKDHSKLSSKEDWTTHKDVADELFMPEGRLDGAVIHGYAWPSEGKNEDELKALSRKRAAEYESWLKTAFADPREASAEVRVQMDSRTYPHIETVAHGSAFTNWEQDDGVHTVPGAQLVLSGERADSSTVKAVEMEEVGSFSRSVERLCNNPKDPTGENPRTLRVAAGELSCVTQEGSGVWTEAYEKLSEVCGFEADE
jgi:hypothetical protein